MAVQFVHQFLAGNQKEMTGQKPESGDHKTEISTYENHKHQYSEAAVR